MKASKIAARWLLPALLALLLPIVSGCANAPAKRSLKDSTPLAGCSERIAGLPLPPPPETDIPPELPIGIAADWELEYRRLYLRAASVSLDWMEAYTGAARAYTSEVRLRGNTADCLDAHRAPAKTWWQRITGG